jgi:hypothetical protein
MNRWDLYVKFHAWRNRQAFEAYQAAADKQHFDELKEKS